MRIGSFNEGCIGPPDERKALRTTHRRVWSSTQLMLEWLLDKAEPLGMTRRGVSILELGSGTGWMYINLAARLPHARIVFSEQPHACEALRRQIERTVRHCGGRRSSLRLCADGGTSCSAQSSSTLSPFAHGVLLEFLATLHNEASQLDQVCARRPGAFSQVGVLSAAHTMVRTSASNSWACHFDVLDGG